jgi:hypothetical protein
MNNIVCVASPVSVGCTFVDWSVHFLSGKKKFYSVKDSAWVPLSSNPVQILNAHGHKKNHPSGYDSAWQYINQLSRVSSTELLSLYPIPLSVDLVGKQLNFAGSLDSTKQKQIIAYCKNDLAKIINSFVNSNIKVVYITMNKHNVLYNLQTRSLDRLYFEDKPAESVTQARNHIDQLFFKDSIEYWTSKGLTNTWDLRERLALCSRPFDISQIMEDLDLDRCKQYCHIDAQSLWYNGTHAMKKIMNFLNLAIDKSSWDRWVEIYHDWQQIQLKQLNFVIEFEHIMNAIVNNWYYEIRNLTFEQEVVIQHCLIYKHGLNLKTWQLEKFPSNTQDLYKLLEPNIHAVPVIY